MQTIPLGMALGMIAVGGFLMGVARGDSGSALTDLAPLLRPIHARHRAPGLIAAIVDGDRMTAVGAVGLRKAGAPERFTVEDQIHLGSDTKAMTAFLIGQLIENRQLAFTTPMDRIFPDLVEHMNPAMARVTVADLLSHTSGLPADKPDWWALDRLKENLAGQRRAAVKQLLASPPEQAPGTKHVYSNANYVILGAILEQKTGLSWEELIRQRLFEPLKMTSAGFGPPGAPGRVDQPWGHVLDGNTLKPLQTDNAAVMDPAGRVHCTIGDWAKFISLFLQRPDGAPNLLGADVRSQLITPRPGIDYAGGWITTDRSWGGGAVLTHAGSNTMWYCVAWVAPKKNFAVLAAVNLGGDDAAKECDEAAAALIDLHNKRGTGQ